MINFYNARKYLEGCINSILNQTFQNFEIILVDDGSTDGSLELVQDKFKNDSRFKFFKHETNLGVGCARNTAVKLATGKYLYFIDADDAILPNALEILYNTAEETQAEVVHMSSYYSVEDEYFNYQGNMSAKIVSEQNPVLGMNPVSIQDRFDGIGAKTFFPGWTDFCRTEFIHSKHIFSPEITLSADVFWKSTLLCLSTKFYKIDKPVYIYRHGRSDSITFSGLQKHLTWFLNDLPEMITYTQNLLQRDDLIEKIAMRTQHELTSKLISLIYTNSLSEPIRNAPNEAERAVEKFFKDAVLNPTYYDQKFMLGFLEIFCSTMSQLIYEHKKH